MRRDTHEKTFISLDELEAKVSEMLETIQKAMYEKAKAHRDAHNGDAPQAARQHPTQSADESAEEKPEEVADRFHRNTSLVAVSEGDWFYLKRKL